MIPLINVVFLLLIFVMLIGKLSDPDPLDVSPPRSASERTGDRAPVTIHLGATGELAVGGEPVARADLPAAIRRHLGAGAAPDVRLKADRRAGAGHVIELMEVLRGAGLKTVRLVTRPAVAP